MYFDEEELTIKIGKNTKINYKEFYLFLKDSLSKEIEIEILDDCDELLDIIDQNIVFMNYSTNPLIIKSTALDLSNMIIKYNNKLDKGWLKSKFLNLKDDNILYEYLYLLVNNINNIKNIGKKKIINNLNIILIYNINDINYYYFNKY